MFAPPVVRKLGTGFLVGLIPLLTIPSGRCSSPSSHATSACPRTTQDSDSSDHQLPDRSLDAGDKIDRALTRLALAELPREFSDTKRWGQQAERWNGIELRREGLRIETQRRKKLVNHGTWKKFSASLRNPEQEFQISLKNIHESDNETVAFEIHVAAHLDVEGRQAEWVKGVQLYSVNATGHTQVRLVVTMEMEIQMGLGHFPPDVIFKPRAKSAKILLDDFRIDKISKIGGEFTQQISDEVREMLEQKIETQESRLVEKINEELIQHQSEFQISWAESLKSPWASSTFWASDSK